MARRLYNSLFHKNVEDRNTGVPEAEKLAVNPEQQDDGLRLVQGIEQGIQKISQNVSQLEKLVIVLGTPQDSSELRLQLSQMARDTNEIAKQTEEDIKKFSQLPVSTDRNNQQQKEKLTLEFYNILRSFQLIQTAAAEKERAEVSGTSINHDCLTALQSSVQASKTKPRITDTELSEIKMREKALLQLEGDIQDLNTMFKDLSLLIKEQGEVLDKIEDTVATAEIYVTEGLQQLPKAREYQDTARRKKCCFLLVTFLSIVTVVGIILTAVVNKIMVIVPVSSVIGIIVTVICTRRSIVKIHLKNRKDGTDIELKAKGTQDGISIDFKAKM